MPASPHVTKASKYARDVVAGKIPACVEVRQACQRHLDDLAKSKAASYPFRFDNAAAERVCAFIEIFPHIKGDWAARGELIVLEPWQCFIVCAIFGWLNRKTGKRRFRTAYVEVPRKNGKSMLAAGIGLYMFAADGETGAECYSGATSEKQAWEVFGPAKAMAQASTDFRLAYGVRAMHKNLSSLETKSKFEPLIGKPGDGASPTCAIVDEYHEHKTPDLFDTMVTGMKARSQPLTLVVTTAGFDLSSPCYEMHGNVQQILGGLLQDDRVFGVIYGTDESDDWQDPATLRKANPNFGVSVFEDEILAEQQDAIRYSSKTFPFLTKHLNKWVSARSAWLNLSKWQECANLKLRLEDLQGLDCFAAIDLASRTDIASVAYVGKQVVGVEKVRVEEDGTETERTVEVCRWKVVVRSYLPEGAIERAKNNRAAYERWRLSGHLIVTPGDELDFDWIKRDVTEARRVILISEVAYDPWRGVLLAKDLEKEGAAIVEIPQLAKYLSPAMREIEAAVEAGRFEHQGDPCYSWQMANVVCKEDANRNIFPRQERDENKIDGAVTTIMGVGRGLVYVPEPPSIFANREALGLPPRASA